MNSTPNPTTSMAGRALLAVALMIGFYLLALGISFGLLYIPYAEVKYTNHIHLKITLLCVIGAIMILWSVLPRFDRFQPPGPQLTEDRHPQLFEELKSVARSVGQEMPSEVYLVSDVNAWVTQRGGIMGFGSRRVMGLGLPLMRLLTRPEFRAVLAHEFGHFHGGDTQLGPWVYKTRNAIGRTLNTLSGDDGQGTLLQLPFLWYGKMFLRISHAVSRQQEFVADNLAARTVGSVPLAEGLKKVHAAGPAFDAFWHQEYLGILNSGFQTPMLQGFDHFRNSARIREVMDKEIEANLKEAKANPYDTHPPLAERIAAVQSIPPGTNNPTDEAISLLQNPESLETDILRSLAGNEAAAKLKPIDWNEAVHKIYLPNWTGFARRNLQVLQDIRCVALADVAKDLKAVGMKMLAPDGSKVSEDEAEPLAKAVLGAALVVTLSAHGATIHALPGQDVTAKLGDHSIAPFQIVEQLSNGEISSDTWTQSCQHFGIANLQLAESIPPVSTEKT